MNSAGLFRKLARSGLQNLAPYKPGKPIEELEREIGRGDLVKLASNENPLGPPARILAAISREHRNLARYPDGGAFYLKEKLSGRLGISPEMITLGNGSNDVLEMLARAFLGPGTEAIVSKHCFVVYPLLTRSLGADLVEIETNDFQPDLVRTLEAVSEKTRMIFLANPNNPTGTWVSKKEIIYFMNNVPSSVLVVLDEAYFEYVQSEQYPNGIDLQKDYENLIVTRTFSKAYGLAGLRIGYSVSNPEIADLMNRLRQPFNVNSLSLVAAGLALDEKDFLDESISINTNGMKFLEKTFGRLDLEYICSAGNFLTVDLGQNALPIYESLLQKGVIVRPIEVYGLPNHLRVSIGLPHENERFSAALAEVLSNLQS